MSFFPRSWTHVSAASGCSACDVTSSGICHHQNNGDMVNDTAGSCVTLVHPNGPIQQRSPRDVGRKEKQLTSVAIPAASRCVRKISQLHVTEHLSFILLFTNSTNTFDE